MDETEVISGSQEMYWLNDPKIVKANKTKSLIIENLEIKNENLLAVNQFLKTKNDKLLGANDILEAEARKKDNEMVGNDIKMKKDLEEKKRKQYLIWNRK